MIKYDQLKEIIESKGYKFFEGNLNINLIGVRSEDIVTNEFDDALLIAIEMGDVKQVISFGEFTTDPGFYYLKEKHLNSKGCAILKPGQYRGMWGFGKHRGKYKALVQVGNCTVYRDRNKDNTIDTESEQTGLFGINHHHAYDASKINKYSAGCQVHRSVQQLNTVLALCHLSATKWGKTFSYTLLELNDFKNV